MPSILGAVEQFRERRQAANVPILDFTLDLRRHKEVGGLARVGGSVFGSGRVHVVAATVVLGTIATLWEALVASNMSSFAGFTAVTRFGVALARWTTTWADHFEVLKLVSDERLSVYR